MQDVPMIETFINAYTANKFNVEMLVKKINGKSSFKGKNPVDPFCYQRQTRRKGTLKRTKKKSFDWYKKVIESNGEILR